MLIKTSLNYSPNFSTSARIKKNIKYIIYHYTGMRSENKAIKRLTDLNSNVSCHYFIKRNGQIILIGVGGISNGSDCYEKIWATKLGNDGHCIFVSHYFTKPKILFGCSLYESGERRA